MLQLSKHHWYAIVAATVVAAIAASYLDDSVDTSDAGGGDDAVATAGPWGGVGSVPPRSASSTTAATTPFSIATAMGSLNAAMLFDLSYGGGLMIDRSTRSSIEALINAMPENPSKDDLARLEHELRAGLPKEAAEKAFKLFTDYSAYRQDVQREIQPKGIPTSLQEANQFFDQMEAFKRSRFDAATADAIFGKHDEYARLTMEAMFVQQDTGLTPAQKTQRLDALRAKLPADQQSLIPREAEPAKTPASQPSS